MTACSLLGIDSTRFFVRSFRFNCQLWSDFCSVVRSTISPLRQKVFVWGWWNLVSSIQRHRPTQRKKLQGAVIPSGDAIITYTPDRTFGAYCMLKILDHFVKVNCYTVQMLYSNVSYLNFFLNNKVPVHCRIIKVANSLKTIRVSKCLTDNSGTIMTLKETVFLWF